MLTQRNSRRIRDLSKICCIVGLPAAVVAAALGVLLEISDPAPALAFAAFGVALAPSWVRRMSGERSHADRWLWGLAALYFCVPTAVAVFELALAPVIGPFELGVVISLGAMLFGGLTTSSVLAVCYETRATDVLFGAPPRPETARYIAGMFRVVGYIGALPGGLGVVFLVLGGPFFWLFIPFPLLGYKLFGFHCRRADAIEPPDPKRWWIRTFVYNLVLAGLCILVLSAHENPARALEWVLGTLWFGFLAGLAVLAHANEVTNEPGGRMKRVR